VEGRGEAKPPRIPLFPPVAACRPGETRNEWKGSWRAAAPPGSLSTVQAVSNQKERTDERGHNVASQPAE
jgi:hypothetical protein